MIKDLLMPPHLLRQRLRAKIVQRAHYASVVENLQRRLSNELLDVDLVVVVVANGRVCEESDRVVRRGVDLGAWRNEVAREGRPGHDKR